MRPATDASREEVRLLAVDTVRESYVDASITDLPDMLRAGDLVVLNDAATLPASLHGTVAGQTVELRLAGRVDIGWTVVLFGEGDWRERTENRAPPPLLRAGDVIRVDSRWSVIVREVSPESDRLLTVAFTHESEHGWDAVYRSGRPVQYAYLEHPLNLWSVQTVYGSRPWAVEMPSAGRPPTWATLLELPKRGVELAALTHAAGLSSTGDPHLDRLLPFAERFEIPQATIDAVKRCRGRGGRVVAIGTSVVRALEGCHETHGELIAGAGETALRISATTQLAVVDGLVTGMHAKEESHYELLSAFAPTSTLESCWRHAERTEYHCHEFGDVSLLLPNIPRATVALLGDAGAAARLGSESVRSHGQPVATKAWR